jgi:hypothetical protein
MAQTFKGKKLAGVTVDQLGAPGYLALRIFKASENTESSLVKADVAKILGHPSP